MSRITRLAVLVVGLMSLFGIMSATAGAVTWHNTGSTNFTATTGPGTLSSTSAALNCTGGTGTGDAPTGSTVAATYLVRGTVTFSGCSLSGISTGVDCAFALTGSTQPAAGQTTGNVDVTCRVYQFNTQLCHIDGSLHAIYTNPTAGVGTLTITTGGNLTTTNPPAGSCPLGNDDRPHLSHLTFRTTSASPPVITRTA